MYYKCQSSLFNLGVDRIMGEINTTPSSAGRVLNSSKIDPDKIFIEKFGSGWKADKDYISALELIKLIEGN